MKMLDLLENQAYALKTNNDEGGWMLLHWAAENGHDDAVWALLISDCIEPNEKDGTGRTLLHWAAENGHDDAIWALLTSDRVEPNEKDGDGLTPLH